jgi:hypothetical protein
MSAEKECIGHARDFLKLTRMTNNEELRDQLVQMACEWLVEAMHARPEQSSPTQRPSYKIVRASFPFRQ